MEITKLETKNLKAQKNFRRRESTLQWEFVKGYEERITTEFWTREIGGVEGFKLWRDKKILSKIALWRAEWTQPKQNSTLQKKRNLEQSCYYGNTETITLTQYNKWIA